VSAGRSQHVAAGPEEMVATLTAFFDALEHDDRERCVEIIKASFDPAFEFSSAVTSVVEGRKHLGHEGMRRYIDEVLDAVELTYTDRDFRAIGSNIVLFLTEVKALGHASRAAVDQEIGFVFEYRDGAFIRGNSYPSHFKALTEAESRGA
jgi:hypothetical protein